MSGKKAVPTLNVISSFNTSCECTNSQRLFRSSHLTQLKKDKERLQAMMAHLKSSEPKAAAQPVSICSDCCPSIKINIVLLWLQTDVSPDLTALFFRWIWCLMFPSPRQHCPKALLLWACPRAPRHRPRPWRHSLNPPQSSLPIACSLEPQYGGGTAALSAKVSVRQWRFILLLYIYFCICWFKLKHDFTIYFYLVSFHAVCVIMRK